jgi:hypothetical protein
MISATNQRRQLSAPPVIKAISYQGHQLSTPSIIDIINRREHPVIHSQPPARVLTSHCEPRVLA